MKEVNKILQLDGYEATSEHGVSAVEYVGNNLDQLLPRWGEAKFWVGHAYQNMALCMEKSENPRDLSWQTYISPLMTAVNKYLDTIPLPMVDNSARVHLRPSEGRP